MKIISAFAFIPAAIRSTFSNFRLVGFWFISLALVSIIRSDVLNQQILGSLFGGLGIGEWFDKMELTVSILWLFFCFTLLVGGTSYRMWDSNKTPKFSMLDAFRAGSDYFVPSILIASVLLISFFFIKLICILSHFSFLEFFVAGYLALWFAQVGKGVDVSSAFKGAGSLLGIRLGATLIYFGYFIVIYAFVLPSEIVYGLIFLASKRYALPALVNKWLLFGHSIWVDLLHSGLIVFSLALAVEFIRQMGEEKKNRE